MRIDGECTVCGGQNGNHSPWCGHAGKRWLVARPLDGGATAR